MSTSRKSRSENLKDLRLPALWKRFTKATGETTRCPNKAYLVRRISEAREATDASTVAPRRPARPMAPGANKACRASSPPKHAKAHTSKERQPNRRPVKDQSAGIHLGKLSVTDLQDLYAKVVGRPTGSSDARYLSWKIRQAQKGRVPVGPRRRARVTPGEYKVIPLRMEAAVVDQIDAARERLELPSRTALIRRALMLYLTKAGENDVVTLLQSDEG